MNLRHCDSRHFIRTIGGGSVIKVSNVNANGRSALKFKSLKDVYDEENETRRSFSDCIFDNEGGRCESKCFPHADGVLWEQEPEIHEFGHIAGNYTDSDYDGDITLKQLKKQVLTKKRKGSFSDKKDDKDEQISGDESDLREPLVNWKINRLKISKSESRRLKPTNASSTPAIGVNIKCKADSFSEGSPLAGELAPVVRVKVEIQDSEFSEQENQKPYNDDSYIGIHELNNVALCEHREPLSCGPAHNTFDNCEGSSTQWDYPEPIQVLFPVGETSFSLNSSKPCSYLYPEFPPLAPAVNAHNCESNLCSSPSEESEASAIGKSINTIEISEQTSSSDTAINSRNMESVLSANTNKRICWYTDGIASLKNDNSTLTQEDSEADSIADQEPTSVSLDPIEDHSLNSSCRIDDELAIVEERHTSLSPSIDTTSTSSSKNLACEGSGSCHPPQRIPSTRKAISPASQERLCTAMNSILIHDNDHQFKTKRKLFGKETRKCVSTVRSETEDAKITVNDKQFRHVTQQNIVCSKRAIMKSISAKGNLEGPRFSRTLRNFSTDTSIEGCSRSAIMFSQRQMQDMESVALKLMNELKCMKDIAEQKLIVEAYRNASLKNGAHEVKLAINSATKAEETARKWLSIMSRDCNRFCKIMEMAPHSAAATKDNSTREKKISFADEAGEKLCHVRFFQDIETSNASGEAKI